MKKFLPILEKYYLEHKRNSLPWRKTRGIYPILLSEVMLQQTQVPRVLIKYREFLEKYPTVQSLSNAPLRDVLMIWQGLGYNRRAKYLHETAQRVAKASSKDLSDYSFLNSLSGIGPSTAGAILAFTKNKPVIFIETNIRAIILHHFFQNTKEKISDKEVSAIVEKLLQKTSLSPRDFYYAMYDYGTYLKASLGKDKKILHSKSTQYAKQSAFSGSRRQLRAFILKTFLEIKNPNMKVLCEKVMFTLPESLEKYCEQDILEISDDLKSEGFFK